jgi:hypothetical protein
VIPHLTVAHGQEKHVFDEIETDIAGRLPVRVRISSVSLFTCTGRLWRKERDFPLAGPRRRLPQHHVFKRFQVGLAT